MAKLKKYELDFDAPTGENSEGVAGFNVYVVKDGTEFSYDLPSLTVDVDGSPTYTVDLAALISADGTYDTYVTSFDAAGNESDPAILENTVVDFTAPAKPVNLRLR